MGELKHVGGRSKVPLGQSRSPHGLETGLCPSLRSNPNAGGSWGHSWWLGLQILLLPPFGTLHEVSLG